MGAILQFTDGTATNCSYLPQANEDGLVDVTHVVHPSSNGSSSEVYLEHRQTRVVAFAQAFCRRLCQGKLPLDAYAINRDDQVLVQLVDRPSSSSSRAVSLADMARNGLSLDLRQYHRRWMEKCLDTLTCSICHRLLTDANQSRYVNDVFVHDSCSSSNDDALPLDCVPSSVVTSHIKTALSAILVAGTVTAADAVFRLITMHNLLTDVRIGEDPPLRPYAAVLAELKAMVVDGFSSSEYVCPPRAFACLPDGTSGGGTGPGTGTGTESWFCLPTRPNSSIVLGLLREAVRVIAIHGRYGGREMVLRWAAQYPAHRLRWAPPPILTPDGQAPIPAWHQIMQKLAQSTKEPALTKSVAFRCQVCRTAFHLKIGACGHLACARCSLKWKTCQTCGIEWRASQFKSPQMNYHPAVFPFKEWYEYLPVTGWCVYRGPDELVYDSSARHLMALARGEVSN